MQNPKTTWAGIAGLLGTLLVAVGQVVPGTAGHVAQSLGAVLAGGAAAYGNIASADGEAP